MEFLEKLAAERPVVLLVEDLHWAESELLELLDRLLRDVSGPLLLVATARPELVDRNAAWAGGRRGAEVLWLEPLSVEETERMASELLAAAELPEPLRAALLERAGGNPFFVEELLATLIDEDVLERSDGGWAVRELPAGYQLPDSVQAVLAARIDLLPAAEKAALQAASVVGRIFWTGPVYELLQGLEPDFAVLEDRDFIRRRSGSSLPGEREYAIKHALTREVAYAGLPKARRARLHAAFAAWLERLGEGWKRLPEQALVNGWIERALELAEPGSATRATALLARSMWHRGSDAADAARAAVEASTLAERVGRLASQRSSIPPGRRGSTWFHLSGTATRSTRSPRSATTPRSSARLLPASARRLPRAVRHARARGRARRPAAAPAGARALRVDAPRLARGPDESAAQYLRRERRSWRSRASSTRRSRSSG